MTQTCRQAFGRNHRLGGLERARRNRCADGSRAANPRRGASPDPIRRDKCDSATARKECEGTVAER